MAASVFSCIFPLQTFPFQRCGLVMSWTKSPWIEKWILSSCVCADYMVCVIFISSGLLVVFSVIRNQFLAWGNVFPAPSRAIVREFTERGHCFDVFKGSTNLQAAVLASVWISHLNMDIIVLHTYQQRLFFHQKLWQRNKTAQAKLEMVK